MCELGWHLYNDHCYIYIEMNATWVQGKVVIFICNQNNRFVWHKNNSFVQFIYKIWIRQRFFIILLCLKIKCSFRFNVCDFVNDFVASLKCYWSVVMWFCFSLIQSTIVFCHTNQCDISCAIQHKFFNKFNVVKLFRLKKLQLQIKRVHIFNSHRIIVTVSGLI